MKASNFLEGLNTISKEDLLEIDGVGEVLADNYISFLQSDRYSKLLTSFKSLESKGLLVDIYNNLKVSDSLVGEKICITGSFDIPRSQIKSMLESKGAKIVSAVTKNTTILLSSSKSTSKFTRAKELGIPILSNYSEL